MGQLALRQYADCMNAGNAPLTCLTAATMLTAMAQQAPFPNKASNACHAATLKMKRWPVVSNSASVLSPARLMAKLNGELVDANCS